MKSFKILLALFMIVHHVNSQVEVAIDIAQNVNVRCGNSGSEDCENEDSEFECPPPFEEIPGVGCLYLCPSNGTWQDGVAVCEGLDGCYFSAETVEQYMLLKAYYEADPPADNDIWVGVLNEKWLCGRDVATVEWIPGGPTGSPCGFIDATTYGGHIPTYLLNEDDCDDQGRQPLCQYNKH